ncbi:peptidoglycan D,D-transpeptidase FtsI family protein [Paenibacillus caui]|uniref:peptidoglycan D,D-transpeptidase FtsI family protein n=1 Tax=Paenibacillus caui TaxID=2873927 RepID=UPI001CA90B26|nr:penicillin-binding transpeptidase domain-containing protein [Paenibacillus caui]
MKLAIKKRIFYNLLIITAFIGVLLARLAWLQLFDGVPKPPSAHGRTANKMAVMQRESRIELDTGRGRFVDMFGRPLTNEVVLSPALFPLREDIQPEQLISLSGLLGTSPKKLVRTWKSLQHPAFWTDAATGSPLRLTAGEAAALERLKIPSVKSLPVVRRYANNKSGKQWLGFVAEQPESVLQMNAKAAASNRLSLSAKLGAAGLEKTFDRLLRGEGVTDASYLVDAYNRPLSYDAMRVHAPGNPYYPLTVVTTIHLELQNRIEQLASQKGMKEGAIVILDAKSGDIAAMVSLPFFNPNKVDAAQGNWSNRAVKAAVPGSIFKVVTAAAALETGVSRPGDHFMCRGGYGKYGLSCWKKGGHGDITLARGFAESCNTVFGNLGERLSPAALEWTADALGLGRTIGWKEPFIDGETLRQIDQEEAGTVFGHESHPEDSGVRAQTAIGQRSVLLSPLQAANMVVTLLHGGVVQAPRLVSGIQYANGTGMVRFKRHESPGHGRISAYTANTLMKWMRAVVTDGTGKRLQKAVWDLAGKSGTAQVVRSGKALNDQWFIGFGPVQSPKYAAAVLVQSREPGSSHLATELFGDVMDILSEF